MANINSPRDGSFIPAILVKDTVSSKAISVSGLLVGSVEAATVAIVDGSGTQITSFGGGTQYTDGGTPPTHPVGNTLEFNNAGTWATVGSANPLPITGSFTITNPSTGSAVPATANYIAGNKAGNLVGVLFGSQTTANSIAVVLASDQVSIPVAATLNAETTKVIGTVNQGTSPWVVSNGGTFAVQAAATLNAETTKVIGVVRNADGSGNLLTSTSNALDINLKTIAGSLTLATVTTVGAVTGITNALPAGTNLMGKVGIDQTTPGTTNGVSLQLDTTSGWLFNYQSALSSTKAQIKGSAGKFGGYINLYNPNTAVTYIQVFNKASASVTVGSTAPDFVITLPGLATASGTGTDRNLEITMGVAMGTGITIAATTTATGSTAPSNTVVGTFLFV